MLVICNGAVKSGSTWLFNVLSHLVPFEKPPERYLTGRNPKHPCIRPELLQEFLQQENYTDRHYLSKNHLDKPRHRDLLLANPHVYVFDIERDPRDVVVSSYYHDCFRNGYTKSFQYYYWEVGRQVAARLSGYHTLWRGAGPRSYVSSYEALHADFADEVRRIAAVIGIALDDRRVDEIEVATSLRSLRKDYEAEPRFEGQKFFRKGEIGDWKNHFDARMLDDIRRIQQSGIARFDLAGLRGRISALLQR